LDKSDKCRAKRTGIEISGRRERTVTNIEWHDFQNDNISCTGRAGQPHVRLEASTELLEAPEFYNEGSLRWVGEIDELIW
jgi:hypothetical protein